MNTIRLAVVLIGHVAARHHAYLAAPGDPAPAPAGTDVHTSNIISWIATHVLVLLLCVLATIFIARASKGEVGKTMTSMGIMLVGVALFAGAGALLLFGDSIVHTIFG